MNQDEVVGRIVEALDQSGVLHMIAGACSTRSTSILDSRSI
jgi:hypothetical protein